MSDFEERVRRGLRSDLAGVEVEQLLGAVHHRATVRRRRRLAAVAVAVLLVVAAGAGVASSVGGDADSAPDPLPATRGPSPTQPAPTQPAPTQQTLPEGATQGVIDVSVGNDELFRLTSNLGCVGCSTIWRQSSGTAGGWQRLHDFGAEAYVGAVNPTTGPVTSLVMADDDNGWAWGRRLFATHDGGRTWAAVTTGPGRSNTEFGHQVVVTDQYVWSLLRTDRGTELWQASWYGDTWTRVRAPNMRGVGDLLAIGRHVALQTSDEGLTDPRLQYSPNGSTWGEVGDPCAGDHRILPASTVAYVLCDGGRYTTVHLLIGPEHQDLDLDHWESFGIIPAEPRLTAVPVSELAVLIVDARGRARLMTPEGTRTVDLGLMPGEEVFAPTSAATGMLVTSQHRVLSTTDEGRTWSALD